MSHLSGRRLAIVLVVLVVGVQALMVMSFAWPASSSGPRELPVAVAGPPPAADEIARGLAGVPGADEGTPAFEVIELAETAGAAEAEQAIRDREAYGAVVATPDGVRVLVASGAGPAVAQLLTSAATQLAEGGAPPAVEDVVPGSPDDPNGAGLAVAVLPLVMTSGAAGVAIGIVLTGLWTRVVALAGLAVAGGAASAAILQYVIGVLPGPYVPLASAMALIIGAVAGGVAGLGAALGPVGAGLGMLTMLFVGNPLSAATSAPELLPFGAVGQALPPGAGVSLIRSVSFFDGAVSATPLLVLGAWVVAGLVLVGIGAAVRRSSARVPRTATDREQTAAPA